METIWLVLLMVFSLIVIIRSYIHIRDNIHRNKSRQTKNKK